MNNVIQLDTHPKYKARLLEVLAEQPKSDYHHHVYEIVFEGKKQPNGYTRLTLLNNETKKAA
jgi:hypothetical protein